MIRYKKDTNHIVTLTLDMKSQNANVVDREIGKTFFPVLRHLQEEKMRGELRGVIITSAKKSFLVGADVEYLYQVNDPKTIFEFAHSISEFARNLESPGVPVVAAINGTALGSGFEIVMACHHRIAVNNPKIELGYPEVTFGLMPSSGGVIRLMWLLGIEQAYQVLISGQCYSPKEALEAGFIDALADNERDMMEQAKAWLLTHRDARRAWDSEAGQIPYGDAKNIHIARLIRRLSADLYKRSYNNFDAPKAILSTLSEGSKVGFNTACRIEGRYFTQLLLGKQARNMVKAFLYDTNAIKNGISRPRGFGKFRPKTVGVIGAGMMGSNIAYTCLIHNMNVILKDISRPVAEIGKQFAENKLKELLKNKKITPKEKENFSNRIKATDSSKDFEDCDLVIEAVFENAIVKGKVTREAEESLDQYSIMASNTSSISITKLSLSSTRPENFVGIHFFPPADEVPLIEVVKGENTSDETVARAFDFARALNKIPIVVRDSPGFYVARILNTYILEGIAMLQEGYAPALIENISIQSGMPKGPLVLADDFSFRMVLEYEQQAAAYYGAKYIRHPAVDVLYDLMDNLDRTGKQKRAGFYDYSEDGKQLIWSGLTENFPTTKTSFDSKELIERFFFVQAIEAAWCLQNGVIGSVAEANLGSVYGWGFPSFKGGVMQYINDYGTTAFVEKAKHYQKIYGQRFKIPKILKESHKTKTSPASVKP